MNSFNFASQNDVQVRPTLLQLATKVTTLVLLAFITIPTAWPLYLIATLIYDRPPNVVHLSQVWRYIKLAWSIEPPAPGLSRSGRIYITMKIIQAWFVSPLSGLAWLMDEVLYGRALDNIIIKEPVFVVSAGRSGSTQITRYLEADPTLVAPCALHCMFPYVWLWKLVPCTIGRFVTPEKVVALLKTIFPKESLERHPEFNPFKADTFDPAFLQYHLISLAFHLGPDAILEEFNFARYAPHNKQLWECDFVAFVDRLGKKAQFYNKQGRFYIKGHFLSGAPALAKRYPDASFLAVVREPLSRIQSGINFMRVQPLDSVLGPTPWLWLAKGVSKMELDYCNIEKEWFGDKTKRKNRLAVRFVDLVANPKAVLENVYKNLLGIDKPPEEVLAMLVKRQDGGRELKRGNYQVDRSLEELEIDPDKLRESLADYIIWCKGEMTQ